MPTVGLVVPVVARVALERQGKVLLVGVPVPVVVAAQGKLGTQMAHRPAGMACLPQLQVRQ